MTVRGGLVIAPGLFRRRRPCRECGGCGTTDFVQAFVTVDGAVTSTVICDSCLDEPMRQALHKARREYDAEWDPRRAGEP